MLFRCLSIVPSQQKLFCIAGSLARSPLNRRQLIGQATWTRQLPILSTRQPNVKYSTESKPEVEEHKEHGILAYKGLVSSAVRNVKIFSLSTSAMGLSMQPILVMKAGELGKLGLAVGGMCSFFIFLTPVLLHWITKKYVSHLYFRPQERTFTAVTLSFFIRKKYTIFTPEDVTVPAAPGAFTTILVKGRALFMDPRNFDDIDAYRVMMGYDQPIDWSFPGEIQELQRAAREIDSSEDEINRRQKE